MGTVRTIIRGVFVGHMFAAMLFVAGCASVVSQDERAITQKIEHAKSRADHEELAAIFQKQQGQSLETAQHHRRMADKYAAWGGDPTGLGRGSWGPNMAAHCRRLAEQYERTAGEQAVMADLHRQLAAQAAP